MLKRVDSGSVFPLPVLIAGFTAMALVYFFPAGTVVAAICMLAAPTLFLFTVRRCQSSFQLFITGLVFAVGLTVMKHKYCPGLLLDIGIFFLSALFISPAFYLDRRYCGDDRGFSSTLVFPAAWVSLFFLSTIIKLGFQFRLDAFVTPLKAFIQVESIIGSCGVLFLILWSSSVVVYLLEKGRDASRTGTAVWAVIIAGCTVFGAVRLQSPVSDGPTVRIAFSTGPYVGTYSDYTEFDYEVYAGSLEQSVSAAAEGGAELVMFSEEAFLYPDTREQDFSSLLSELACRYNIHILSGEEIADTDGSEGGKNINRICWTSPDGSRLFSYVKRSVVPIVESFDIIAGKDELPSVVVPFKDGDVKVSCAICYDSNFSAYISAIPAGTRLLLLPSWDWQHVSEFHGEVAREIAIENGVTVLKDTYDGVSLAIGPLGETILESRSEDNGYEKPVLLDLRLSSADTLFGRFGPFSGYIITAFSFAAFILLEIRKRKEIKK